MTKRDRRRLLVLVILDFFQVVIRRLGLSRTPLSLVNGLHQHPHSVTPSLVRKATVTAVESGQSVYFYL